MDAEYKFLWANFGAEGSASDCGVFNRSSLEHYLRDETLGLPLPEPLPSDDRDTPYFIIGDNAFPLRTYLVKLSAYFDIMMLTNALPTVGLLFKFF